MMGPVDENQNAYADRSFTGPCKASKNKILYYIVEAISTGIDATFRMLGAAGE